MEHNKEGRYREIKRARQSTSRRRGYIGKERERDGAQQEGGGYRERKRARWSTTRRGDIGRERERDGAQQEGGEI